MKVPVNAPTWLRNEVQALQANKALSELDIALLVKLFESAGEYKVKVWQSLEKQERLEVPSDFPKTLILLSTLRKALRPLTSDEALTAAERRKIAKRVSWAATEFAAAWQELIDIAGERGLPWEVEIELAFGMPGILSEVEPYSSRLRERKEGDDTICPVERALLTASVVGHLDRMVRAAATGAEAWGRRRAALDKPRHANAARLRFIRVATESFVYHFGSPMREAVLALTTIWFGDSGLTPNALSELAKVADLPTRTPYPRSAKSRTPPD